MTIFETVGTAWIIFTSALAHFAIIYAAYRHLRRTLDLSTRGEIEERRDVQVAMKVREQVG